jgi:hypothetical protein
MRIEKMKEISNEYYHGWEASYYSHKNQIIVKFYNHRLLAKGWYSMVRLDQVVRGGHMHTIKTNSLILAQHQFHSYVNKKQKLTSDLPKSKSKFIED